ncbi:DUF4138 domain-containing protein, partial [Muribaculaceae bacterium Isolate-001 (NCI)]
IQHIVCKRFFIAFIQITIYNYNALIYYHSELENKSNMAFDIDCISLHIVDTKVARPVSLVASMMRHTRFPLLVYS